MKLVEASLCGENTLQRTYNRRGGAFKHLQVCLNASKNGECSFHYCGCPVKLVQTCLFAGNTLQRRLYRRGRGIKHVQACF